MDLVEEEKGRRGKKQIGMREEGSRCGEEEKRQAGDAEFLASLRARLEQRRPVFRIVDVPAYCRLISRNKGFDACSSIHETR